MEYDKISYRNAKSVQEGRADLTEQLSLMESLEKAKTPEEAEMILVQLRRLAAKRNTPSARYSFTEEKDRSKILSSNCLRRRDKYPIEISICLQC